LREERLAGFPVILIGSDYWRPLVTWLRSTMYARGCISDVDVSRFILVDSPEEVVAALEACISANGDSVSPDEPVRAGITFAVRDMKLRKVLWSFSDEQRTATG
jgi:predicted Rossmann-fold nucleotide-binding protein